MAARPSKSELTLGYRKVRHMNIYPHNKRDRENLKMLYTFL